MRRVAAAGHVFRVLDSGGSGVPVLFAADAPVVLEHYAARLGVLAARRRVVAVELPGFGFSTPGRAYRFALSEQVEALRALLDAMLIDRAQLAFSCINGFVALALAGRYPERVERLVLQQVPSAQEMVRWANRIDKRVLGRGVFATPLLGQVVAWALPHVVAERWFALALSPRAPRDELTAAARRVYANGGAFCLGAIAQVTAHLDRESFPAITVPTTIVWGEADRTHRKTHKDASRAWHPDAQIHYWPDVGHCPDLESPERFAALLEESGT